MPLWVDPRTVLSGASVRWELATVTAPTPTDLIAEVDEEMKVLATAAALPLECAFSRNLCSGSLLVCAATVRRLELGRALDLHTFCEHERFLTPRRLPLKTALHPILGNALNACCVAELVEGLSS